MKNNNENYRSTCAKFLGKKVRVLALGKYYHQEGIVREVKNTYFPDIVLYFNGEPKGSFFLCILTKL